MILQKLSAGLLAALWAATLCPAQNADLGLLFSVRHSSYEISPPPNRLSASSTGVSLGFVPAFELRERGPHRFYVEAPYLVGGGVSAGVTTAWIRTRTQISTLSAGPRYQYALSSRWSVYTAAGLGVAWYTRGDVLRSAPFRATSRTEANPVFGYGAGLDCRLSKLISLRGELRHYVLFGAVPGSRLALAPSFGMAVHF